MAYNAGDVVLVPFPYRDQLGQVQTRPGVIVSGQAYNAQGDIVVAALTSHPPRFPSDYALADWKIAGLHYLSTARMLFTTFADNQVIHFIGRLTGRDWAEVRKRVTQVFS